MKAIVDVGFKGAPDGEVHPRDFEKGDTVTGDLARVAVEQKWATEVAEELPLDEPKAAPDPSENKAQGNSPENKRSKSK